MFYLNYNIFLVML